jgi:hypothetical protein
MRGSFSALIALACVSFVGGSLAAAQSALAAPVFRGRVVGIYDEQTGEPIAGVEVRNLINGASALTTKTGTVLLTFVDTSGGLMTFKKLGYEQLTLVVANSVRDTTPLTLVLRPVKAVLPVVVTTAKGSDRVDYISPKLRAFEERRQQGLGSFIPEAELRKDDGGHMSETLVKHIPGVHLVSPPCTKRLSGGCPQYFATARGQANFDKTPCYVTIYVDGALYYSRKMSGGQDPPDPRYMNVTDFAGVEYYAGGSTMPPEYNATDSGCGLLLFWTRER